MNKVIGRSMSASIINKWISIHAECLEKKDTLMVHEFLYLLCNSKDKSEMVSTVKIVYSNEALGAKDTKVTYESKNG